MEKFYKTKDIQDFLTNYGMVWDGVNKNKNGSPYIINANIKSNNRKYEGDLTFIVDELSFVIYGIEWNICYEETDCYSKLIEDLSSDWVEMLVKEYPDKMKSVIDSKIKDVKDNARSEIEFIREQAQNKIEKVKINEERALRPLEKLRKMVSDSTIQTTSENVSESIQ